MTKTHELEVSTKKFDNMISNDKHIIVEQSNFEEGDYILVHKMGEKERTGITMLVSIQFVNIEPGLKDGFVLLVLNKVN